MAEQSILWETVSGVGDSQSSGYDQTLMFQLFRSLFARTANMGGVSPEYQNELTVTGITSPVAVNTGAAVVYGIPYVNTASVSVAIPTPSLNTRIDRLVLRANWAARTVRIQRIAGTEGAGAPSLTQVAGTTWDVPLAQISITTGGIITVFDQREWLGGVGNGVVGSSKLVNDAVSNAKLADMAQGMLKGRAAGAGTGDPVDLDATQVRALLNVADGANAYVHPDHTGDVTSMGSGATTIANDAVTNSKLANMAQNTLKGRVSFGVGDAEDLSVNQAQTLLNIPVIVTGTFTPQLRINGVTTGIAQTNSGRYLKIGPLVFVTMSIILTNKGSQSGNVSIAGLPFAAQDLVDPMGLYVASFLGFSAAVANLFVWINPGATLCNLHYGSNGASSFVQNVHLTNGTQIVITGTYRADS